MTDRLRFLLRPAQWLLLATLPAAAATGVDGVTVAGIAGVLAEDVAPNDDLISITGMQPAIAEPALTVSQISANAGGAAPFRFLFLNNITGQPPEVEAFVIDRLMPAAAAILSRSVRVRR